VDLDPGCAESVHGQDEDDSTFIVRLSSIPATADADADGRVDLRDLAQFVGCFSAAGSAEAPAVAVEASSRR